MYQAVFFDVFNTLVGLHWPGRSEPKRLPLQKVVERRWGQLDAKWQATYGRARASQPGETNRFSRLMAALADRSGVSSGGPLALWRKNEQALHHWFSAYEDTLSTLSTLHSICKLGVISNAWPYLESILRLLGIWDYFESVIISARVGLSKPSPAIYELALRTLHMSAQQAVFVDDLAQNVAAAERVGLKGLWLVRTPVAPEKVPARYRHLTQIDTLAQLIPFMESA